MRGVWIVAAAFAVFVVVGIVTGPRASAARVSGADRLRALERTRIRALVDADTTTARAVLAGDFQLVTPDGTTISRRDYLDAIGTGDLDYRAFTPLSPIAVRVYRDAAALRYRVRLDVSASGLRLTHEAWITGLYELRSGRWQMVWEQTTAIPRNADLFFKSLK